MNPNEFNKTFRPPTALAVGDEIEALVRSFDWSQTSLGPIESWPLSLQTTVSLCLGSNFPINIIWGQDHVQIYNAGYRDICGTFHPKAIGEPFAVTWATAWPVIRVPFERALVGEPTFLENQRIFLVRNGYFEETFFTFSFSPIRDETGKVVGLFHPVTETTQTMLRQRRTCLLLNLREKAGEAKTLKGACDLALRSISEYPYDVPMALLYLVDGEGKSARLAAASGVPVNSPAAPKELKFNAAPTEPHKSWPLDLAAVAVKTQHLKDIESRFGPIVCGEYPEVLREAFVFPLGGTGREVMGFIVLGVSPRLSVDESYSLFLKLLSQAVESALTNAHLYEEDKKRASTAARGTADVEEALGWLPDSRKVERGDERIRWELRQSNERNKLFMAVLEYSKDFIGMADENGKPIYLNPAGRKAVGLDSVEDVFKTEIIDYFADEEKDRVLNEVMPIIFRDGFWDGRVLFQNFKTGEKIPFSWNIVTIPGEVNGGIRALACVSKNLTEQEKGEKDRKKAEADLKMAVEQAQLASEAKTRFLANMSHEIRTPLGVIQGFADLVLESQTTDSEKVSYLMTIKRNAENLTKLLGEVLDLSKIEAGKIEIEKIRFSLPIVIEDVISLLSLQAKDKGIALRFETEGSVPQFISSDPTRLRQILINLVGNAIKFTERGHVLLKAKTVSKRSKLESIRLQFCIEDTGIGLTPEQQTKLFQPFTQADSTMTRKYGGTGLGLNLSERLVRALGGDLKLVSSEIGKGSKFQFNIDAGVLIAEDFGKLYERHTPSDHSIPSSTGMETRLRGIRVLLVEDSPDNQLLILRYLGQSGAEVDTASDGREGVKKSREGNYDIILMDIQMPQMDGYEATDELRKLGNRVPILALTAHALPEEKGRALRSGFNDFLTKPLNRSLLIETIVGHVRR